MIDPPAVPIDDPIPRVTPLLVPPAPACPINRIAPEAEVIVVPDSKRRPSFSLLKPVAAPVPPPVPVMLIVAPSIVADMEELPCIHTPGLVPSTALPPVPTMLRLPCTERLELLRSTPARYRAVGDVFALVPPVPVTLTMPAFSVTTELRKISAEVAPSLVMPPFPERKMLLADPVETSTNPYVINPAERPIGFAVV